MEKSKKITPEEAKREANDQIDRARIEREKQMEAVQEIAEPLEEGREETSSADEQPTEIQQQPDGERKGRNRGRGRRGGRDSRPMDEPREQAAPVIDMEDFGFERIVDDGDTGDMFKDAYMQEAIVDRVRAVEFDMEGVAAAEVGSLIGSVAASSGFERIADEDDQPQPEPKGRKSAAKSRGGKGAKKPSPKKQAVTETAEAQETEAPIKEKKAGGKAKAAAKSPKGKSSRGKAKTEGDQLEDSEASLRESNDQAEMTVRRGGRGRRRGGRGRKPEGGEGTDGADAGSGEGSEDGSDENRIEAVETDMPENDVQEPSEDSRPNRTEEVKEAPVTRDEEEAPQEQKDTRNAREPREGRDNRGGRDNRNRDNRDNRDTRDVRQKPAQTDRGPRNDRNDRGPRNDRSDRNDRSGPRPPQPTISDLLREGQEILVQIAKEPIARKGARITSHIALPGRYLVYMPTIEHLGVSRKIESSSERSRLRTLIQRIKQDVDIPSGGFIVRTAGIGISEEDLKNDAIYLVRTWLDIKKTTEKAKSPALVHQDLDIVQRILRDQMSDEFTAIRVDSEEEYLRTVEFVNRIQPKMVNRVKLYTRDEPILDAYGVQEEIDKALKPRVWLKSGGYLVINQTEALVAIDVNTGKFVGKGNARLEDTITRTNMEAVDEIARQIRLRDLGGIIVLDLIDMEDRRNRNKVSQALQEALASDKSPNKVLSFNDFGLIIMTRKRVKQSLERTMCSPCDYCEGAGWVKSPTTVCYEVLTEARRLSKHIDDVRHTTLRVHPDVAKALRSTEKEVFEEIEAHVGNVDVTADKSIHQEQFDFAFI
ncbi:MAG: Rne/Rng family ribonuclease [Saprospiraceae bacterium]|nr:Rne/Rng family ribonuclease [Pyrinomonadaceae bacterium]